MNSPQEKAREFMRKYHLGAGNLNLGTIKNIIRGQGFHIVYYSRSCNDEPAERLLTNLGLKDYSRKVTSFIHMDDDNKLVFVLEDLTEDDQLVRLLHEEAHIFDDHRFKRGVIDYTDTQKEDFANAFAGYVLSSKTNKRTRIIAIAAICLSLAAVACYMFATLPGRQHVYITRDGDKYHNRDCQYVEGKDLAELTVQEAIEAGYEPCSVCF